MATDNTLKLAGLAALVQQLDQQTAGQIQQFRADQAARAARLTTVRNRLVQKLGASHPRIAALNKAIDTSTGLAQNFDTFARRISRRRSIDPNNLVVLGRVLNKVGKPMQGVSVRVSNQEGSLVIGPRAETGDAGDFTVVLTPSVIPTPVPQLFVLAEDSKGARLAMSSDPVILQAGSPLYVELVQST